MSIRPSGISRFLPMEVVSRNERQRRHYHLGFRDRRPAVSYCRCFGSLSGIHGRWNPHFGDSVSHDREGPASAIIRLRGWDVATGKEVIARRVNVDAGDSGGGGSLADDGTALWGFTSDGKLHMWDTATGHEIVTLDPQVADPSIERARGHFAALANGRKALVWRMGGMMMVWDIATKTIRLKHTHPLHWSAAVAFSADGKLVAWHRGGPPHVVQVWDWNAGKQLAEMQGFAGHVYALRFSPDGKVLAAADELGTIRLMDVATSKEIAGALGAWCPSSRARLRTGWELVVLGEYGRLDPALETASRPGPRSIRGRSRFFSGGGRRVAGRSFLLHVFGFQTWPSAGVDPPRPDQSSRAGKIPGKWQRPGFWQWQVRRIPENRATHHPMTGILANREFILLESPSWPRG